MQDCGIQGDQHSLKLFAGECDSYQLMSTGGVWIRRYREWDREREMDERLGYNITFGRVRYPFAYPYPSIIQTPVLLWLAAINVFLLGKCLMCPFVSCLCSTFSENLLFLAFQSDIRESTSNSRYINPVDI